MRHPTETETHRRSGSASFPSLRDGLNTPLSLVALYKLHLGIVTSPALLFYGLDNVYLPGWCPQALTPLISSTVMFGLLKP